MQTVLHCKAATLVAVLSDGLLTLLDAELLDAHLLPGIKVRTVVRNAVSELGPWALQTVGKLQHNVSTTTMTL